MAPFHFGQMGLKTGSFGAESALNGVRKVSVKIERPQAVDRFYANQSALKAEPISNDQVKISGSLEMDYVATTVDDLHTSDGATSLVWEFIGPVIEAANAETFRITLPAVKVDDAPPQIEGFDVIRPTFNFTGLYDGTNLPVITYISTDVTL
jgi:hypothetical protein